jgi:hypothetical protein
MTFEMVRIGWPNTAAILALAVMPVVAFATAPDRGVETAQVWQTETATYCPAPLDRAVIMAAAAPDTVLE